jgi:outer membrane receptor protein involved in Fe transport
VAIRGIQNNGQGATTTGFYLDDTPISKRGAQGCGLCTGNGTPLPPLFDLERVEVLRGPQGTLFGSGSQGGTIRYITPTPSLTRYSAYARAEASSTWNGDPSYEGGIAVGGPIVQDKLGFRASFWDRHTGGWLDYRNRVTNQPGPEDANSGNTRLFRGTILWAPTDRARLTLAYFSSHDHWKSRTDTSYLSTSGPIIEPESCFTATGGQLPSCSSPGVAYRRGQLTLPALTDLGKHTTLDPFLAPATTNLNVASFTVDYDFSGVTLKSISSLIYDQTKQQNWEGGGIVRTRQTNASYNGIFVRNLPAYAGLPDLPQEFVYGKFYLNNVRNAFSQEIRLSSPANSRPLSWVAGVFFSNQRNTQRYDATHPSLDILQRSLFGVSAQQRFGAPPYMINGVAAGFDAKYQTMKDIEIAAFGEANYWITEQLRATLGIRVSHLTFDYRELHYGPAYGNNDPTALPGGITGPVSVTESPVAPRLGLQYQITDNDMVYVTVAKGYRGGGVNSAIPAAVCGPGLARVGLTVADLPLGYSSDTVWSYEAGAKVRVLENRVQLNGSVYRIDWSNIQTNVTVPSPCGIPTTTNAGQARSQGFELESEARLFRGLSLNLALAYDDAKYTDTVVGLGRPGSAQVILAALEGQRLTVNPWTVQVGARYDRQITDTLRGYVRVDWRYLAHYSDTASQIFGSSAYSPTAIFPDTTRTNLRVGLEAGDLEVNFFVNNLFNSRKGAITGGYSSCPAAAAGGTPACTGGVYNPYFVLSPASAPRQIGLQLVYRR